MKSTVILQKLQRVNYEGKKNEKSVRIYSFKAQIQCYEISKVLQPVAPLQLYSSRSNASEHVSYLETILKQILFK